MGTDFTLTNNFILFPPPPHPFAKSNCRDVAHEGSQPSGILSEARRRVARLREHISFGPMTHKSGPPVF